MTTIDLSDYDVPGRGRGILDVFQWRYLLRLLVRKGTATRYRNSVLGWVWSYVKPGVQFGMYYVVMGVIFNMNKGISHYPIYLFAGIIAINFFNEAFGNSTNSVVDNRSLVQKIYLPRELFPISAIIVAVVHFLPQVVILLVVALLFGWLPTFAGIGAFLLGVLMIAGVSLGLGLFFAGLNVRYRDAQNFVEILRMLSTWASPVLYTWELVEQRLGGLWLHIYMSNPVTVAVELFHYALWQPTVERSAANQVLGFPDHFPLYVLAGVALTAIMLVVGQFTFRHFERTFAQDL